MPIETANIDIISYIYSVNLAVRTGVLHFSTAFYQKAEVAQDSTKPNHLVVAMSSDRGLCGGIHSSVVKYIKAKIEAEGPTTNTKLVIVGDKARGIFQR